MSGSLEIAIGDRSVRTQEKVETRRAHPQEEITGACPFKLRLGPQAD